MKQRRSDPVDRKKRNSLLTFGAVGLAFVGLKYIPDLTSKKLSFSAMERPHGFRKYVAGESSVANFDPFIGLDPDESPQLRAAKRRADHRVSTGICNALYPTGYTPSDIVPVASFSDYYCPYCRVQTQQLSDLSESAGLALNWHELPLLGDNSDRAARAALAAKRQDAYVAFHAHLMRTPFAPTSAYLGKLSDELGIDETQLRQDMQSPDVIRELENSAALSRLFGFIGTPALVIGRTVIQGKITDRMVREIADMERQSNWSDTCAQA